MGKLLGLVLVSVLGAMWYVGAFTSVPYVPPSPMTLPWFRVPARQVLVPEMGVGGQIVSVTVKPEGSVSMSWRLYTTTITAMGDPVQSFVVTGMEGPGPLGVRIVLKVSWASNEFPFAGVKMGDEIAIEVVGLGPTPTWTAYRLKTGDVISAAITKYKDPSGTYWEALDSKISVLHFWL